VWIINLWRFLRSYLKVRVEGVNTEKFINLAVIRGVAFWDLKKHQNGAVLELPANNLKKLRVIARKTGCSIKILEKKGLLFWWRKGKKRKGFVLGFLCFVVSLYIATLFVWNVQATGMEDLTEREVIELAAEAGLEKGMLKWDLDTERIENRVAMMHEDIVWAGVRIRGTTVEIKIVEHKKREELPPEDVEAHLVASKDGLVEKVLELEGEAEVKPGDTVSRGEILIRGAETIKIPDDPEEEPEKERVYPKGKVEARVWYESRKPVPEKEIKRKKTGEEQTALYIKYNGRRWRLRGPGDSPYQRYWKKSRSRKWGGNTWQLPLELVSVYYYEIEKEEKPLSRVEAVEKAKKEARSELKNQLPQDVEVRDYYWEKKRKNGQLYIRFVIETIEDIAEIKYN